MRSGAPILLIEDDKVDQLSVKRAMKDAGITNRLVIASHGEEALDILNKESNPCLILLDLNMPKMNGIEFLRQLRTMENSSAIPVIVITTSNSAEERVESYRLGVCGFMIKPVEYPDFVKMLRVMKDYWTLSETPY